MESGEDGDRDAHTQPPCRFFSQGRYCSFGKKCKFLHVREDVKAHGIKTIGTPGQSDAAPPPASNPRAAPAAGRRPCRYFMSGHCSMEDRCRFWHPPQCLPLDSLPGSGLVRTRPAQRMPPVPRPSILQEVKLRDLTEDLAKKLRDTEIKQLMRRFPKDQLIIQERSDGKLTYYRATVQATDPDWVNIVFYLVSPPLTPLPPLCSEQKEAYKQIVSYYCNTTTAPMVLFDLKEVDIMVSFPDNYPQEIFTLDIPLDQNLPLIMARHVQQASLEWLQAKHATNQLLSKIELLFLPFLRWLDRSLERLFTEGARQLKKDIDLEKAGLQFIPYQELQATVCERSENDHSSGPVTDTAAAGADVDVAAEGKLEKTEGEWSVEEGKLLDPGCDEEQQQEETSRMVENIKISDPRRGTEVKMLGLRLGENTATVVAQQITVCLQCNRCKVTADLTLSGRMTCTAHCEKCNASINAGFRPCMLHHYSDVLGYLDLHNASPADLVLQDCVLIAGCLSCSQDLPVQNLSYGQTKEFNCEHCHSKLSILAESTRFQHIQPRTNKTGPSAVNFKTIRDPAVQKGKPLPEKGTCKHYKQSHRWLRFPCCGRAYPCDVCHDEDQDHPMELATRMICGYCAKEQPFANGKPCISCGSMMTRGARSSHWEGGLGCRNKIKMSRNDRQKYANTNKTVSRKAASEKK